MDQQFQNELEATKASFYKLQDNFNHNLRVISQLEQDNEKLLEENENLRAHYHKQIDELHGAVQRLRNQNSKLSSMIKNEVMKTRAACEEQTQHIIEMMNQKMMEQKRYEAQKYARQKKEAQSQIQKLEQSLRHYTIQNSKLLQTIKQQRNQKDTIQTELASLLSQKQAYANKFSLHQKELENLRASNQEWQNILKDKVKEANKQKQKAEEELSEAKLSFKLKLKGLKEEASKKIEEIEESKEKSIRLLTQQARQIKFRFDTNFQQLQKLRAQAKTYQKQKQRLQQNIEQLSKQANSQKQIQYLKKMQQQERIQLKNEIKMLQNEKNQIKEQLKQTNQRRQQVQKTVERLKTGLIAAQKDVGESQKRNKKMEREIKELRNQIKRLSENGNINLRGFNITKMENQDGINQNVNQNQANMDYSKYFSEDMGPADQMFFMQNSIPKSPKNAQIQSAPSQVNHQLLKKIGQLQVETDQYKNIIKTMTDDLQKIKTNLTDQITIKQQQIKLNRDQIYLLRQKINQRQQQLLSLNSLRQQLQEKNKKINEGGQKVNQLIKEVDIKRGQNKRLEGELEVTRVKFGEMEEKLGNVEEEKRILEEINEELRGQIHQFKNRIRLYNQSEEQSGSDEYFQEIRFDQSSSIQQKMKKSTQIKKKSRSRSKSGNKNRPTPPAHQHQHQGSTTSMKLRDLVLKKKQLQMQGKKMNIEYKQTNPNRNIEKAGTQSQKQILETMKRRSKSKSKGKQRAEKLKNLDYDRLMGRRDENDAEND